MRRELKARADDTVIGLVCRITSDKGIEVFLDAAGRIVSRRERVKFVIVGGPSTAAEEKYFGYLQEHCRSLDIAGSVEFLGFRSDARDLYYAMDIVCACSLESEGFNYTIAEGMAAGLPVVASRCGGQVEIVEDGRTGLLYRPTDAGELAEALEGLVTNPDRRACMGRAARQRFTRLFDSRRLPANLANVYDRILCNPATKTLMDSLNDSLNREGVSA